MSENAKSKKKSTGRKCSICSHKDVDKINSQIAKGVSFRSISYQFGMAHPSVSRHTETCLKLEISALIEEIKTGNAIDFNVELKEAYNFVLKQKRAAERWLTDPNNPDEFTIAPRADEMDIVYYEMAGDMPVYKTSTIQNVIDQMRGQSKVGVQINVKAIDNRDYALKTLDRIDKILDKYAKIQGLYQQDAPNKSTLETVAQAIKDHLREYPDHPVEEVVRIFAEKGKVDVQEVGKLVN